MSNRLNLGKVKPAVYTAMDGLDQLIAKSSIDEITKHMIRLRASQINGCAYCVDLHSHDAREAGASEQFVYLVSAWREAGAIFTAGQRLILQMTEEVTLIHQHGLKADTYDEAVKLFGEEMMAELLLIMVTINAWNRIGVALHMTPAIKK